MALVISVSVSVRSGARKTKETATDFRFGHKAGLR